MTFVNDLKFGKVYENDAKDRLVNAKIIEGKFKPYDMIDEDGLKYEVKSDRWTFKTGNLCIEFECNNKPSGITSSEADFYFYYVVNTASTKPYECVYKIPTVNIREMINKASYHKIQKGGDLWRSKFYLFKVELFEGYKL
jgi:hypothetical protein